MIKFRLEQIYLLLGIFSVGLKIKFDPSWTVLFSNSYFICVINFAFESKQTRCKYHPLSFLTKWIWMHWRVKFKQYASYIVLQMYFFLLVAYDDFMFFVHHIICCFSSNWSLKNMFAFLNVPQVDKGTPRRVRMYPLLRRFFTMGTRNLNRLTLSQFIS